MKKYILEILIVAYSVCLAIAVDHARKPDEELKYTPETIKITQPGDIILVVFAVPMISAMGVLTGVTQWHNSSGPKVPWYATIMFFTFLFGPFVGICLWHDMGERSGLALILVVITQSSIYFTGSLFNIWVMLVTLIACPLAALLCGGFLIVGLFSHPR
jgi:hypothetical protein